MNELQFHAPKIIGMAEIGADMALAVFSTGTALPTVKATDT